MKHPLALALALLPVPVMAEVPRVVTDIPPVHALVSLVMEGLGEPALLLERGANAHSFALRPSQAAGLQRADLVVWTGPEMTPWLDRALDGIGGRAERLGLLAAEGTFLRDYGAEGDGGHDHDHDHDGAGHGEGDHDHAHTGPGGAEPASGSPASSGPGETSHGHSHAGHDHSHTGLDPHAWLDPANALVWLDAIAARLSAQDPANAATYAANAAAAKARVSALDVSLSADLAPIRGRPFVVFHDAYGYFASHYGLNVAGSISLGDAAAPGAARLQEIRAALAGGKAVCAFPEAQHDPKPLATLAEGTGVRIGPALDPSGSSLEPGPDLYERLMRGLAEGLSACLN